MSTIMAHAEALTGLEKQYRSVLAVGEFLRKVGSIEQVEAEAIIRRDAALQAAEEAQAQRTASVEALRQAQQQVELATLSARTLVANAEAAADDILAAANEEGARRIASAQAQAEAISASLDGVREEQRRTLEALQATRAEYDDLVAKLDALKRTAASIAGR